MPSITVHVSNIAHDTTESDIKDFFSFCGKITSLSVTPSGENQTLLATINFERESAAKTAVLLDGTPLKDSPLSVKSARSIDELAGSNLAQSADENTNGEIPQESKPHSTIFAEYLAAGYALGDAVLERGIELDKKHGLTSKFASYLTSTLQALDNKTHASDTAKSMDNQYNITEKAMGAKSSLARYFEKALETGPGNTLLQFYTTNEKRALDIHNEAKRLAELKLQKKRRSQELGSSADGRPFVGPDKTTCGCAGNASQCGCEPGKCACADCDKSKDEGSKKAGATGQFEHAFQDIKQTAQDVAPEKV